ncbi:unnamed protein product [Kuraishia capsulata CBS 1993]|uniref:DNA polymerase epsilon catalytic subunit n=1 Tax=Kuraishia capsulata CBS 1993 TaxID=1382522 RepID=W6MKF6_9ASCO|nr:uncharacterized protein KUCA_T00002820001 [Kuraishia capsulata CBS 1993]CDK26846.1 unnamed protein product [Kuraishia capsulata CBS 1993]
MATRPNFKGSNTGRYAKNRREERNYNDFSGKRQDGLSKASSLQAKFQAVENIDRIDSVFEFNRYESGPKKIGWLVNMHATTVKSSESVSGVSGVDYYFLDEEGGNFKATVKYDPYFLLICKETMFAEAEEFLRKKLDTCLKKISRVEKEDLSLPNHLIGLNRTLLKLSFHSVSDLLEARRIMNPILDANKKATETKSVYSLSELSYNNILKSNGDDDYEDQKGRLMDASEALEDIREYDVPYHVRVSIDKDIRVGKWYIVEATDGEVNLIPDDKRIAFADPVVLAFDIETTKAPLKFPDSSVDQIMMISYMIDGEGFLITNREIISQDIEDFEYTPKPEYPGLFAIFNEKDEKALIERFFEHIRDAKPTVIATFNGDFFDWPFVEARAAYHDIDMFEEIGFAKDSEGEYKSTYCAHMDCYRWVKRDSYLPQGSQGLKAVTTVKLGYNPTELDPELMTPYAIEKPQVLSEYSVSDAVATYYLYYKYVHPFIFSLCTIIPLNPDEVLRKGTGTLCEMLLMVQAYQGGILLPNKHTDPLERFYDGHLVESETYVGGHVESLEAGVFRSDLENEFEVDPTAIDELLGDLDEALKFCIEVEGGKKLKDVTNFDEVRDKVKEQLIAIRDTPKRKENPLIYHIDVASMYPNIMTTNRLQPDSMKAESDCASCDFNRPGKTCDRRLPWSWRGEFYPAQMNEYGMIKRALQHEDFPPKFPNGPRRNFEQLSYTDQVGHIKKRLSDYSRKVYHRVKQTETIEREAIICQRENPFYVNTVRDFRDRRYEFKTLAKVWKGKTAQIPKDDKNAIDEAKKMVVLYDSLQLAHKVILNSFYGYVMRKGSRWYSMEMAGITCLTGATIIQMARALVERLGRPLELDTDGIWCILPSSFPENFNFELKNGKKIFMSYPGSMMNYIVHQKFTNHQYQELIDPVRRKYETKSDNSIFFEVDGPYRAMILPTSKEEGKGLKKRYAVFNFDGSLAELKGFELKRRGELQLVKNFQSDIFKLFLDGTTLEGCYGAVANVANRWLDVLDTKGSMLEDEDLIELICENRSMSKTLAEYGNQKSTSITTAKRLGEFLGEEMVKDKGLACKYIIARTPLDAPITERAIPVAIFSAELSHKRMFLRRWLVDPTLEDFDPRSIIDWGYYKERLASVVQKIITIPAALQDISNPVPRVPHPDWLQRRIADKENTLKQKSISNFFAKTGKGEAMADVTNTIKDLEDYGTNGDAKPRFGKVTSKKRRAQLREAEAKSEAEAAKGLISTTKCPSPDEDYVGFLMYQKLKWKVQETNKARRRELFGNTESTGGRSSLNSMMRDRVANIAGSTWQILEYRVDPDHLGNLIASVLIDDKVQTLTFKIPKKVYLGYKSDKVPEIDIANCEFEKSTAVAPSGTKSGNIYKLSMPEDTYKQEMEKCDGALQSPDIDSIYESQIQSVERAIMDLGACVEFSDNALGALGKGMHRGFEKKSLVMKPSEHYLSNFSMDILYLLHIVSNQYEIFALFNSWDATAEFFVLKPSSSAQELPANISKLYKELYESKFKTIDSLRGILEYPSEINFETHYFGDITKLYRKLSIQCNKIHDSRTSKPLLAIQSPNSSKILKTVRGLSVLPKVHITIGEIQVSSLNWQNLITKRILNHFLSLSQWIKRLVSLSKYGNIPLCNLKVDNIGYLIDIEYARRLSKSGIILWWSPTPLPDHGGIEKQSSSPELEESFQLPSINRPDVYESVSLELELKNLTINTILTSSLINEAEGTTVVDSEGTTQGGSLGQLSEGSTFAEDSFFGPALIVLRSMVKSWWDDAMKNSSDAESMIHSLVSWILKPMSFLYDPALNYHIHNLTKKSLLQLLAEFKRMGASIVSASRNKIILKTSKLSVENSYAYGNYLVNTARSKPLFNFLELNVVRYWDILMWMDEYNYSGRYCVTFEGDSEPPLESVSHWQIKSFLPPVFQPEFEDWAIIFLDSLIKHRAQTMKDSQNGTQRVSQISKVLKLNGKPVTGDLDKDEILGGVCELFRKPLEKRIQTLIKLQTTSLLDASASIDYEFPNLPGSHLKFSNAALELVKSLCHILSLDKDKIMETRMLRRDLLKYFDVKEFSEEANFRYPASSLYIPQVCCEYCNHIRDIDMCRDDEEIIWSCESCGKPFNKVSIEEKLIQELLKLFTTYFYQDLKCDKCGRIKQNELAANCACSGRWQETKSLSELQKRIKVYTSVSKAYDLSLLRAAIEEAA